MEKKDFLGIDVSKLTIDCHLYVKEEEKQFSNTQSGFKAMKRWIKQSAQLNLSELVICFEATGSYSFNLTKYFSDQEVEFTVESGYRIARTQGLVRGKDDAVDAYRISEYAYRHADKLRKYEMPSDDLIKLKKLYSLRKQIKTKLASFKARLNEEQRIDTFNFPELIDPQLAVIQCFTTQLAEIEKSMNTIIERNNELKKNYDLLVSIKGVGFVLASLTIVLTNNFTLFDDPRKFASYSGTAPFNYESGTSIKKGRRVSKLANSEMRAILTLAAKSARLHDPELKAYADRRLEKGKSKMSTINILRNKLINRMFAVVRKGKPYEIRGKKVA